MTSAVLLIAALIPAATPQSTPAPTRPLTFAVIPLRPAVECAPATAAAFSARISKSLHRTGALIVPAQTISRALARLGVIKEKPRSAAQLSELGRAVGADRVLYGSLRLQAMVRAPGDVWDLEVHQHDVATATARGSFRRVTAFGSAHGAELIPAFVARIVAFDPAVPPLAMTNPVPAKAPADAPREPGMAFVPAGEFIMGSDRGEIDEEPRHIVYTDAFFIDINEVTNTEYDRCVAARKCVRSTARHNPRMNASTQPVAGVGFQDALNYCAFAGKRLLTEAEWEKAARGSDERVFPWGNEFRADFANRATSKDGFTHSAPVGSFPSGASPYGVNDMAGNMWEWTADAYDADSYKRSPRENPKGPLAGPASRRVMRGGSWMYDDPFFLTTHNRSPGRPHIRKMWVGIRCGKDAPR